jgi:hypothetical protein
MPQSLDSKGESLRQQGVLNPHPQKVADPLFLRGEFFDPRDLVQVKYEMLRRVRVEGSSVSEVAQRVFGNLRNLGRGESPGHDVDHGQMDHCLRCTRVEFIVLAHPPKPSQPREGSLHDPATRQELESLGVVASLHDL